MHTVPPLSYTTATEARGGVKYVDIGGQHITKALRSMYDEDCLKAPEDPYPFWATVEAQVLKETTPFHIARLAAGYHQRTQGEVDEPDVAAVADMAWRQAEEWKGLERKRDSRWVPTVIPKERHVQ